MIVLFPLNFSCFILFILLIVLKYVIDFVGVVSILNDDTNGFGFCSSLFASCSQCELNEFLSTGKHNLTDEVPRTIQGKDINRRMVFAASEMGVNRESLCTLATILNMPPPPVKSTWQDHEAALYESH